MKSAYPVKCQDMSVESPTLVDISMESELPPIGFSSDGRLAGKPPGKGSRLATIRVRTPVGRLLVLSRLGIKYP